MGFRERRHLERLTPERFVYIDLKPDNGGIVLNVSRAGLCVQSVAPVKTHQSFTFSFRDHDAGSHGVGEVVWTDESSKFAGLRFTRVSAEACGEIEQIAKAPPLRSNQDSSPEVALVPVGLQDAVTLSLSSADIERASPLRIALLREAKRLPKRRLSRWVPRILVIALAIYAIWAS
ncbi:MAG TPA: PilZ domain-containing protein, partial [Terriglobales bacterium]|nr:PilZ domain-containing protein [Terriglobales bacterium]